MKIFSTFCIGICLVFLTIQTYAQHSYTISGYITDEQSGEAIINAHVWEKNTHKGSASNVYGFYSMTLSGNESVLQISALGYAPKTIPLSVSQDTVLNFSLKEQSRQLEEIEITARQMEQSRFSTHTITTKDIRQKTTQLFGEADVIKAVQMLPGVQGGNEGSSDLIVRGGDPGQNLILLDGVPVYNSSHLLGLLSVFNADAIKRVSVHKGGFPARYGGRLSSVIDIQLKEGNENRLAGKADIGLLTSKFTLEGPLSEKSSALVSGRITPWGLGMYGWAKIGGGDDPTYYNLYDVNLKTNYRISKLHKLYLSLYHGRDSFTSSTGRNGGSDSNQSDFNLHWGNVTTSVRWNAQLNQRLFSNLTVVYSDYAFKSSDDFSGTANLGGVPVEYTKESAYKSGINDLGARFDLDYFSTFGHQFKFGGSWTHHTFTPNAIEFQSQQITSYTNTQTQLDTLYNAQFIRAHELNVYGEDEFRFGDFHANLGVHYSRFHLKNTAYQSLEPRVSLSYQPHEKWSFKTSYAKMKQYLHLISNSSSGMPTDLWVPATEKIKPQESWQVAAGIYSNALKNWSLSMEAYYKEMDKVLRFENGLDFLQDGPETDFMEEAGKDWQDRVSVGRGWSYGLEWQAEKTSGRTTASLAYALAWSKRKFEDLNLGETFPYRYDRRHQVNLHVHHQKSGRFSFGANWNFQSGMYMSVPLVQYTMHPQAGGIHNHNSLNIVRLNPHLYAIEDYSRHNNVKAPDYHRLDVYANFHKKKKRGERTWSVGIYNLYNRKNPYMLYATSSSEGSVRQLSLFTILPSVSYQYKF